MEARSHEEGTKKPGRNEARTEGVDSRILINGANGVDFKDGRDSLSRGLRRFVLGNFCIAEVEVFAGLGGEGF